MRSITKLDLQYAYRFYGFKGEAQYLHGHTGTLTIEVEDSVNAGVNMVFPCNEIQKTAMVSPKARPLARTIAERMPCLAAGTTVVNTPMLRVTPSAIAPCR